MTQLTIEDIFTPEINDNNTNRQRHLLEFLKLCKEIDRAPFKNGKDLCESYDNWIVEHFNIKGYNDIPIIENSLYELLYGFQKEKLMGVKVENMSSLRELRADLQWLKINPAVDYVIVGFNIASNIDEAKEYADKFMSAGLNKFKIYWALVRKIDKHFQTKFTDTLELETIKAVKEIGK